MEVGFVQKMDIDQQMQQAYLDYAMSVIVARALPDARDGLKPVHRRILYAMHDMGLRPDSAYKKSARIVGEVLGKYHPHGDMAVYEAMARMAQDFSMRYLLVDGQGNFGSVDGDPPAAMRYTEARLAAAATSMLTDIGKNTVDFVDNFDGTLKEPSVLPSALPNLLVNGATGIAVGMATNIPPHNLGEVIDALRYMLENWEKLDDISLDHLMHFIQGPDFPTGGVIFHEGDHEDEGLRSAYGTGRGRITVQARAHLEEMERGKNRIIVTELPYMTNKSSLIERIAELVREGKLEGIADLRDESDRQGMRIVIELTKNVEPEIVLTDLYKHTPMQSTFGIILLALVDGEPRMLSLKAALRVYIEHRLEIVRRRSEFDLARARARAHILEGLRIALQFLDEVIDLIRKAPDADIAKTRLMKRFKLSELQAQAILDMPLRRLAALERKRIEDEYKEVHAQIKELESLLRSPKKMRQVVSDELLAVKEAYADRRRTQIISMKAGEKKSALLTIQDQMPDKAIWVAFSPEGNIFRTMDEKEPRLSGKSAPSNLIQANTKDTLFIVDNSGECAAIAVHTLPEAEDFAFGVPFWKVSPLPEGSRVVTMFAIPTKDRPENHFIFTCSRLGMVKKSALTELPGPSATTFTLVKINPDDRLLCAFVTNGQRELLLATARGMAIRFSENDVRPMGLIAGGVAGIKLQTGDEVIGCEPVDISGEVCLIASNGYAKRIPVHLFPLQGRYGQGVQTWKLTRQVHLVGLAIGRGSDSIIIHFNRLMARTIRLDEAPLQTRATQGKNILMLKPGDTVLAISLIRRLPGTKKEEESKEKKRAGKRATSQEATSAPPQIKPRMKGMSPPSDEKPVIDKTVKQLSFPIPEVETIKSGTKSPGTTPSKILTKKTGKSEEKFAEAESQSRTSTEKALTRKSLARTAPEKSITPRKQLPELIPNDLIPLKATVSKTPRGKPVEEKTSQSDKESSREKKTTRDTASKKAPSKKTTSKTMPPVKPEDSSKETSTRSKPSKAPTIKTTSTRRTAAKESIVKKETSRSATSEKTSTKATTPKKTSSRKAPQKETPIQSKTSKKTTTGGASTKKSPPQETSAKKSPAKKTTRKETKPKNTPSS